jgi:hypothetical protein
MKLECDVLLSNFAFNFDLRHYTKGQAVMARIANGKLIAALNTWQGLLQRV